MKDTQEASKGTVFVLMPFSEKFREVYSNIIKPAISDCGYECIRADEISRPGNINEDIAENISRATFVVADLTETNPNVMYELGLSHALGRTTIMISQEFDKLPFDVSTYRVIQYSDSIKGAKALEEKLRAFVTNIDTARRESANPVTDFLAGRGSLSPAEQLPNPVECFTSLCRALESFLDHRDEDEDVKLLRALPTEMSPRSFARRLGPTDLYMQRYEDLIKMYVEKPELDDETVFGCPPDLSCLQETLAKIKASYFPFPEIKGNQNVTEVSAVGFHPYLRGYSLFLLGRKKKWEDAPEQYSTGFIFFLNRHGLPINGILTTDNHSLRILMHLWEMILYEIDQQAGGVKLRRFKSYTITPENHDRLFRDHIADTMLKKFNELNQTALKLRVGHEGDKVEIV